MEDQRNRYYICNSVRQHGYFINTKNRFVLLKFQGLNLGLGKQLAKNIIDFGNASSSAKAMDLSRGHFCFTARSG
jgi:hypothetical protein